jgi:arginyl-tRNA synthetase
LRETDENLRLWRVKLCSLVALSLKNTMRILGIEVPERM